MKKKNKYMQICVFIRPCSAVCQSVPVCSIKSHCTCIHVFMRGITFCNPRKYPKVICLPVCEMKNAFDNVATVTISPQRTGLYFKKKKKLMFFI